MNKILKNTIILTVITLIAGLGLGFVYEITKIRLLRHRIRLRKKHGRLYSQKPILMSLKQLMLMRK